MSHFHVLSAWPSFHSDLMSILVPPAVICLGIYIFLLAAVRLVFHPLRKIPGPKLAALTGWWEFYFDVIDNGTLVKNLPQLHQKYNSPVIRISPNHVHINDPEFYHVVYRAGTDYLKAPYFYKGLGYPESLISILDPAKHRIFRNTIAPLFSPASIDLYTPRIHKLILKTAGKLAEGLESGQQISIQHLFRCFGVDMVYVTLFGRPDEFVESYKQPHGLIQSMDQFTDRMWLIKHFPFLNKFTQQLPSRFQLPGYASFLQQCETWVEETRARRAKGQMTTAEGITTVFDAMLQPNEEKHYESRTSTELIDEAALLIIAGSDTSAYTLTCATYYLLSTPLALTALREELDSAKTAIQECNWEKIRKLPYLMAVVKESLRLSTPVPGITPRVVPPSGVTVQGHFIPGGTIVSMTHRSIHDNAKLFPNPEAFDPWRWLGDQGKTLERWQVAFSKGSRQCVGSSLAYQELILTLSYLFSRFDFELYDTDKSSMEWVDHAVAVNKKPVEVKVIRDRWA
ncbi:CND5p [Trichophyton equinum CBS 127.97]|uniref:CND5p n=1 Tax=Trichophyton equinum (strain ATCC MYA-4606 / CBS 127.97) TaxID=559882 RepID=F2PJ38_TRIEC|nr:CND5p [Trichophyton equinum CBS 127.97]